MPVLIEWAYIVAAILFILGLKLLGKQKARGAAICFPPSGC